MSNPSEQPNNEESRDPKLLYYSDLMESLRKRFAERHPNMTIASHPPSTKETTIEITFINRKKFPKP
jgi:hypothetical protein